MTNMVSMSGSTFSPAAITVKVGTTVTWTNNDNVRHTVTSSNGAFTSSADLFFDDAYSFTFTSVGSYPYFCSVHPHMTGTVTVIP
jgi:plastocyanin